MFAFEDLGLIDPDGDATLDMLVELAAHRLPVDAAAISLIDAPRDRFAVRRAGPAVERGFGWAPAEGAPCTVVMETGRPLALGGGEPLEARFALLRRAGFAAYLGHPILGPAQDPVGAVFAVCRSPRVWSGEERRVLAGLAELARTRVLLSAALRTVLELGRERDAAAAGGRPARG